MKVEIKWIVDGGMKNREGFIIEKELKRTIKLMKENKATDESGMIAESDEVAE